MPGITRGEAIWEQTRDTALPDTQTTLVDPPVQVGTDRNDAQDARLDAIEARLAGIELAIGLFQVPIALEVQRLRDGGAAEMQDTGWVRLDDSDVSVTLENCANLAEAVGLEEQLTAEMYGDRHVMREAGRLGDGDLSAELEVYGERSVRAEGARLGDGGLSLEWYGDRAVHEEAAHLGDGDLAAALV